MPVERREDVTVVRDTYPEGQVARRVETVEDPNAGVRSFFARIAALIWLAFGVLILMIGLRVILRLIDANTASDFVAFVYNLTNPFLTPFFGLTGTPAAAGGVLEIPSIIAMVVYTIVAWIVVEVLRIVFAPSSRRSVVRRTSSVRRDL